MEIIVLGLNSKGEAEKVKDQDKIVEKMLDKLAVTLEYLEGQEPKEAE